MTLSKQQRLDTPISSAAGSADKAAPIDTWLASFCMSLDTARCGVVLEASADSGTLQSAAIWPAGVSDIAYLHPVCAAAIKQTTPVQLLLPRADVEGASHAVVVAHSIKVEDRIAYVVVVDLGRPSSGVAEGVLQRLGDASGWLVAARERAGQQSQHQVIERLTLLTDTIALAGEDKHFRQAAMNIVNELARRFECNRASLGVEKANFIDVVAVSNKASFDIRTEEIRLIADAMDEALDQAYPIIHPAADPDALPVPAHAALAQHSRATSICSIPLRAHGRAMAALTLERHQGEPFAADSHELMAAFGDVLGTLVSLKIAADRGVWRRLVDAARDTASALFGPRHPALKFAFAASLLLVTALSLIHGDYRVAAKTVVEGAVQRAIVVPFDGFVAESGVRAGDVVKAAQLLCRLDDKDLQLEKAKWEAQVAQLLPKYREGLAMHDAGLRNVLGAQIEQAQIELKLTQERLTRASVKAPFDGVVVSGDLSQLLGTPVEKGKVLFEVAPLDAYRVILKVDERDVAALAVGQLGELAVSGMPDSRLPFKVKQITPVSTAEEGQNFFRVEAQMTTASEALRPGMQGVGKVEIGQRKIIWIWTHRLVEWVKVSVWKWMP